MIKIYKSRLQNGIIRHFHALHPPPLVISRFPTPSSPEILTKHNKCSNTGKT